MGIEAGWYADSFYNKVSVERKLHSVSKSYIVTIDFVANKTLRKYVKMV